MNANNRRFNVVGKGRARLGKGEVSAFEISNRNSQDEIRSTVTVVWCYQALPLRLPASHPLGKCLALTSGPGGSGFYCQSPKCTSEKYLQVQQS